jgi:hypothetical protein
MKCNAMCRGSTHDTMSNPYTVCKNVKRRKPKQRKENVIKMSLKEI